MSDNRIYAQAAPIRSLPSLWINSYFVSTVGGAPPVIVRQYIESQKGA